jgi:hypothetical protein
VIVAGSALPLPAGIGTIGGIAYAILRRRLGTITGAHHSH